jgi:hypothetical protein
MVDATRRKYACSSGTCLYVPHGAAKPLGWVKRGGCACCLAQACMWATLRGKRREGTATTPCKHRAGVGGLCEGCTLLREDMQGKQPRHAHLGLAHNISCNGCEQGGMVPIVNAHGGVRLQREVNDVAV